MAAITACRRTPIGTELAKITPEDAALNRKGRSTDAKAEAAVTFASKVARLRGRVSDDDIAAVKRAGYSEGQIVEIIALVAENVMTNFLNNVAQTEIDFPVVRTLQAA
jgi:alkylhydroperoxidase family enzyme